MKTETKTNEQILWQLMDETFIAFGHGLVMHEPGEYISYDGIKIRVVKDYDKNRFSIFVGDEGAEEFCCQSKDGKHGFFICEKENMIPMHPKTLSEMEEPDKFLKRAEEVVRNFENHMYNGLVNPSDLRHDLSINYNMYFNGHSREMNYRKSTVVDPCIRRLMSMTKRDVPVEEADYIFCTYTHAILLDTPDQRSAILEFLDKKRKPGAKIVAIGGMAMEREKIGDSIKDIIWIQGDYVKEIEKLFDVNLQAKTVYFNDGVGRMVIIPANGCMNKCGMCSEAYKKRDYTSTPLEQIKEELDRYQKDWPWAMKNIELYATNLAQYGMDLTKKREFPALLDLVASYKEVEQIQLNYGLTISETRKLDMLESIIKHKDKISRIALHFESGSDKKLAMIGKHTKQEAIELLNTVRDILPNATIVSAMIVGMPGETMKDLDDDIDVIRKTTIDGLLVSPYEYSEKQAIAGLPQYSYERKKLHFKCFLKKLEEANIEHPLQIRFNANPPFGTKYEITKGHHLPVYNFGNQSKKKEEMCHTIPSETPSDIVTEKVREKRTERQGSER